MPKENKAYKINPTPVINGMNDFVANSDVPYLKNKTLEANSVFPAEPKSSYVSSYFADSFHFPYNPDPLARNNNYKIYDEMKHDDQVKSAISFKKDLIVSSGWHVQCENQDIADRIELNLKQGLKSSFENSMRDILSSFEYGFSLTEILYKRAEDGLIEVKDFKTRPPHTFEFHLDPQGDVIFIRQNSDKANIDFEPDYFIHHIYQPEFDNPFGQSDLRAAHQSWKAKKFFFRFWAIYVERFASPTVIGEYPEDFDSSKVSRLQTVLNTIQNSTSLIVPEGTKIDFKMPNRDSASIYEKGIEMLNTMIARAILMPDLLGMSGSQTDSGSRSLGETQFEMFLGLIKREQDSLARILTLKIVQPLVKANWGDYDAEFIFHEHSRDNKNDALRIWVDATKSKLWKATDEEIKYALETMNFPIPDVVEREEPVQMPNQFPANKNDVTNKVTEPTDNQKDFSLEVFRTFREETKYEKTMNFMEIEKMLNRNEDKEVNKLKSLGKDIYADYINQIRERNLLSKFKPELINELKPKFLKPMNIELKSYMKDLYKESYNRAQKEIFPRIDKKFALEEELLPDEFLEILDAEAFKIIGDYSINITNKMRNKLVQGIKNGVNEKDLLSQLREIGEEETDRWLKTVIRTKTTEMFNRGRKAYWDTDEMASQIIEAFEYSAILDDRTSEVCRFLDGKIFEKGELTTEINPPLHFNCRSILVPITKFEDYRSDSKYVSPGKEPSLDSLKEKGGNLIFTHTHKFLNNIYSSGTIQKVGDIEVISSPGNENKIQVFRIEISNMSRLSPIVVGVKNTGEDEIHFRKTLKPSDTYAIKFDPPFTVPNGTGFSINISSEISSVDYTCEYQITNNLGDRIV